MKKSTSASDNQEVRLLSLLPAVIGRGWGRVGGGVQIIARCKLANQLRLEGYACVTVQLVKISMGHKLHSRIGQAVANAG